jgi:mono/diheme cytochrome c family protein
MVHGAHKSEDWFTWTIMKLKKPRIFASDAVQQKMPNFSLADSEAYALSVYLRSMTREYIPAAFKDSVDGIMGQANRGRFLVHWRNCVGCHQIESGGGYIRERIKVIENVPDALGFSPPLLTPEGKRVQEQWLYAFLQNPSPIRPWIHTRMPTFGVSDTEVTVIQKYFLALGGEALIERNYDAWHPDEASIAPGKQLFDALQCLKCHVLGGTEHDPSNLAPNLEMARTRLKPEWVLDWLINPNVISPGTRMPSFFPEGVSPKPDVLGGDAKKQIQAIRDYVFSIGKRKAA